MLRKIGTDRQLGSIGIIAFGNDRNDIDALIAEHPADISDDADFISNVDSDTGTAFGNAHNSNKSTENIAVCNNTAQLVIFINDRQSVDLMLIQDIGNVLDRAVIAHSDHVTGHYVAHLQARQQIIGFITRQSAGIRRRSPSDIAVRDNAHHSFDIIYYGNTAKSAALHQFPGFQHAFVFRNS